MSKGKNTVTLVRQAVAPYAERLELDLWDVNYVKEGPNWFLRIFIDKPGGVNMQDCEDLSRAIDDVIDELDVCEQEYFLEVSSPGLARLLRTDEHLAFYMNQPIRLRLYRPDEFQQKQVSGTLLEYDDSMLAVQTETGRREIARKGISEIRADDDQDII